MKRVSLPSFTDLNIRTKLAIGFGSVFLVAAMVAMVGGFAVVEVRDSAHDARENGDQLNAAALTIQTNVLQIEKGMADMVRAAETSDPAQATASYAPAIRANITAAREQLGSVSSRWNDDEAARSLASLITTYSRLLDLVPPTIELRGNAVAGKEGAFWEQTRAIEDQLVGRAGAERAAAASLSVRRSADEWLVRPDDAAAARVRTASTALRAEIDAATGVPVADRTNLKAMVDTQGTAFADLAEADRQLRGFVQNITAQGESVKAATAGIAQRGLQASQEGASDIDDATSGALQIVATITVIGLLMAALLVALLSRLITGPLRRLSEVSNRMSLGELDVEIDVHGQDEVGQLADSLRRMQASLRAAIERLRARRAA